MRNRKVFLRIFTLAALLAVSAAALDLNAQQTTWRIAALYWSMNIPGQVAMRSGLEAEAAAFNAAQKQKVQIIPYVAGDGERGIENQIKQMRQAIASKVNAIIVQPTDNAALAAPLREANAAGIPFSVDWQGGLFGFYFLPELPTHYAQVMKTDLPELKTIIYTGAPEDLQGLETGKQVVSWADFLARGEKALETRKPELEELGQFSLPLGKIEEAWRAPIPTAMGE